MGKAIQFTHNEEHLCHLIMRNHEKRGTLISINYHSMVITIIMGMQIHRLSEVK